MIQAKISDRRPAAACSTLNFYADRDVVSRVADLPVPALCMHEALAGGWASCHTAMAEIADDAMQVMSRMHAYEMR